MRAFGKTCCGTTDVWIEAGIVFCSTCGNEPGEFNGQEDQRPVFTKKTPVFTKKRHNLRRGEDYNRQVVCAKCGKANIDSLDARHLGITICFFCIRRYLEKEEQKKYLADIEKQKQFLNNIEPRPRCVSIKRQRVLAMLVINELINISHSSKPYYFNWDCDFGDTSNYVATKLDQHI